MTRDFCGRTLRSKGFGGKMGLKHLVFGLMVFAATLATANERLVLVGGGDVSRSAVQQFSNWGGGKKAHVLVVSWATEDPEGAYTLFVESLKKLGQEIPEFYEPAVIPRGVNPIQERDQFLTQLNRSTAVFFTGGDQNVLMKRLRSDSAFIPAITKAYKSGIVFGGSSAGTAIMTETMLTGNGDFTKIHTSAVETAEGLGLLSGFLVDQHFIKRQRQNRILSLLLKGKETFAIGIDEDNAVSIEDSRFVKVLGKGLVMTLLKENAPNLFKLQIYGEGEQFEVVR